MQGGRVQGEKAEVGAITQGIMQVTKMQQWLLEGRGLDAAAASEWIAGRSVGRTGSPCTVWLKLVKP